MPTMGRCNKCNKARKWTPNVKKRSEGYFRVFAASAKIDSSVDGVNKKSISEIDKEIDKAIATLRNGRKRNLKEKYQQYIEKSLV